MSRTLADLVKSDRSLTTRQLDLVKEWIDDDWESHDHDRDIIKLLKRLLLTIEEKR